MGQVIATSTALDIGMALVALIALWALMRVADYAAIRGENAPENSVRKMWADTVFNVIESDARAAAIYYSARWAGGCVLMGMLLG